jgi:hypothetical protein
MGIVVSERQLAITIIVIVVEVRTPIMPRQERQDGDIIIPLLMLHKMRYQHRELQQLVKC